MTMTSLLVNGAGISHIIVLAAIAARNGARKHEKPLRLKLIEYDTFDQVSPSSS